MTRVQAGLLAALIGSTFWLAALTQPANSDLEIRQPGWSHDFLRYYRPNAAYAALRWADGDPPLWNPHQGFGAPFLATLQPAALYPPNALHLILDGQRAFVVLAMLHLAWAAFAMAGLAAALGAGRVGSITAGVLYTASGAVVGSVWTPPTLYAVCGLPAVLWAAEVVRRRPTVRNATALALATGAQLLTGWMYVVVMTALTAAVYTAGAMVIEGVRERRVSWRSALGLAAGAILGAGLAAPLLLPAQELVAESTRAVGTLLSAQATSAGLHDPAVVWARMLRFGTSDLVPGWGAVALATLGLLVPGKGGARTWMLCLTGALALGVSFPFHLPFYDALREVPLLGDFRFPYRYRLVTTVAFCVAAGIGVSRIGTLLAARPRAAWAGALAAACLAFVAQAVPLTKGALPFPRAAAPPASPQERLEAAGVVPDRTRMLWSGLSQRVGAEVDLYTVNDLEPLTLARTARLLNEFQLGRPLTVLPAPPRKPGSGDAPAAAPFYGLVTLPRTDEREKLLDLASVGRLVLEDRDGWWKQRYPRESKDDSALGVYRNSDALPRAYRVRRALPEPDDPKVAVRRLSSPRFDPRTTVMLHPPPVSLRASEGAAGQAEVTQIEAEEPERIVVHTQGPTSAILVLTEAYFPGWEVRVDGEPAPLLRANTAFRAVVVPAGAHEVEFAYRPASWRRGWAVAAVSGLALVGAAVRTRRR